MSELSEAMQAAVESVDDRRGKIDDRRGKIDDRRGKDESASTSTDSWQPWDPNAHGDQGVVLRDTLSLPPIMHRPMQAATVAEILRTEFEAGSFIARVYSFLREVLYVLVLFWVCAILLGFTEDKGIVYLPGGVEVTVAMAAFFAALGLRATLLGGAALNGVLERMVNRQPTT